MTVYCFDTSAVIDAGDRHYPFDLFPTFWERMDALSKDQRLIAPEMLIQELSAKDDDCLKWVSDRKDTIISPVDEALQQTLSEIMASFPALVNIEKNRSGGDPFFIALAKVRNCTLVTGEVLTGSEKKPRIPDVCQKMNIPFINILGLIRAEKWKF